MSNSGSARLAFRTSTLVILLLSLFLAGCASGPTLRQIDNQFLITEHSGDAVWDAVVDVFGDRNWVIDALERDSGIITTDWMSDSEGRYHDCGSAGMLGSDRDRQGRFNVLVREDEEGVALRITTSWTATREVMDARSRVDCVSTGVLEREIYEEVMEQLEGG